MERDERNSGERKKWGLGMEDIMGSDKTGKGKRSWENEKGEAFENSLRRVRTARERMMREATGVTRRESGVMRYFRGEGPKLSGTFVFKLWRNL